MKNMCEKLRTENFKRRNVALLMILGLLVFSLSSCQPGAEQAKNTTVTVSNMTANSAASNTTNSAAANTNTTASNANSTSAASTSITASTGNCGETPGDDEVYIYENIFTHDKGGKCVKLSTGEYKDAAATGLADNVMSSIRVGKNVHAVVCDEANFGGTCMAFDKDDDDFINNATLKNDTATSVKIAKAEICSPQNADKPVELN